METCYNERKCIGIVILENIVFNVVIQCEAHNFFSKFNTHILRYHQTNLETIFFIKFNYNKNTIKYIGFSEFN